MLISTTKIAAAVRQLDVAIDILFSNGDPLAIRTLTGAAVGIFSDLVDAKSPGSSWRESVIRESGIPRKAMLELMNNAQNYLKHADRDFDGVLNFDETENDDLLFIATLECGELKEKLSMRMQAFQLWYLAAYPNKSDYVRNLVIKAQKIFPAVDKKSRDEQLAQGAAFVLRLKNQTKADLHLEVPASRSKA